MYSTNPSATPCGAMLMRVTWPNTDASLFFQVIPASSVCSRIVRVGT